MQSSTEKPSGANPPASSTTDAHLATFLSSSSSSSSSSNNGSYTTASSSSRLFPDSDDDSASRGSSSSGGGGGGSVQWRARLTDLLVDVRDTLANRLMANDEYVPDTSEYLVKLRNRLRNNDERFESLHIHLHPNNPPCLHPPAPMQAHQVASERLPAYCGSSLLRQLKDACRDDRTVKHLTFRIGMYDLEPINNNNGTEHPGNNTQNHVNNNNNNRVVRGSNNNSVFRMQQPTRHWTREEIQQVSDSIFCLSKLEKLECCYYLGLDIIPLADLLSGIRSPFSFLKCLEIHHLQLLNSQKDGPHLSHLAAALQDTQCGLIEFRIGIISCHEQPIPVDDLVHSLATIATLQQVELVDQSLNPFCLGGLTCQSSSVVTLLRQSRSLRSLKINEESFDWSDDDIQSVARALVQPQRDNQHAGSLSRLESLELRREISPYLRSLGPTTLKNLGLADRGTQMTERGYQSVEDMMEFNYTIVDLSVYGNMGRTVSKRGSCYWRGRSPTGDFNAGNAQAPLPQQEEHPRIPLYRNRLDFFLELNRDGRRHVLQHRHSQEWIEALIANQHDLDCIYYFLSNNPSVVLK